MILYNSIRGIFYIVYTWEIRGNLEKYNLVINMYDLYAIAVPSEFLNHSVPVNP